MKMETLPSYLQIRLPMIITVSICLIPIGYIPLVYSQQNCYDSQNRPQTCIPSFQNAAYRLRVDATSTCGVDRPTEFCLLSGPTGAAKQCLVCDNNTRGLDHPSGFMTDLDSNQNRTRWQSQTMLDGIQYPNVVNLTLHFGIQYDVTYIRIRFQSPRPESFAIYKKVTPDDDWIPFQFYSASCETIFNKPTASMAMVGNEDTALCTDEYSDIFPFRDGVVSFSTLQGRPSAWRYQDSEILQQWVKASSIRIVLTRLNTFGDEAFGDANVLKSYFYAISDLAVGGRCSCNGHAGSCITDSTGREVCQCEHNTAGDNCERCKTRYNAVPWRRGTDGYECQKEPTTKTAEYPATIGVQDDVQEVATPVGESSIKLEDTTPLLTMATMADNKTELSDASRKVIESNKSQGIVGIGVIIVIVIVIVIALVVVGSIVLYRKRNNGNKHSMTLSKIQSEANHLETAGQRTAPDEEHTPLQSPLRQPGTAQYDNLPINESSDQATGAALTKQTAAREDNDVTQATHYEETVVPAAEHVYSSLK